MEFESYRITDHDFGLCDEYFTGVNDRWCRVEGEGESPEEFMESVKIDVIHDNGTVVLTLDFDEAPEKLQTRILESAGIYPGSIFKGRDA